MLHAAACCVACVYRLLQFCSSRSFRSIRTTVSTFFLLFRSGCIFSSAILTPSFVCCELASTWFLPRPYRIDVTLLPCHITPACVVNSVLVSRSEFALKFFFGVFFFATAKRYRLHSPALPSFPGHARVPVPRDTLGSHSRLTLTLDDASSFLHRHVRLRALALVVCRAMPRLRGSVHRLSAALSVCPVCRNLLGGVSCRRLFTGGGNFVVNSFAAIRRPYVCSMLLTSASFDPFTSIIISYVVPVPLEKSTSILSRLPVKSKFVVSPSAEIHFQFFLLSGTNPAFQFQSDASGCNPTWIRIGLHLFCLDTVLDIPLFAEFVTKFSIKRSALPSAFFLPLRAVAVYASPTCFRRQTGTERITKQCTKYEDEHVITLWAAKSQSTISRGLRAVWN